MAPRKNQVEAEAETAPTKSFEVVSNLRHNGKYYVPGKPVELTEEESVTLVEAKVVKPVKAKAVEPVK